VPLEPPPPAVRLARFPALPKSRYPFEVFRIFRHRDPVTGAARSPWNFTTSPEGAGRFDVPAPRGTCYWSDQRYGAWLEVFRFAGLVDRADVDARRLAAAEPPRLTFADFQAARARSYGVTGEISATPDYVLPRAWADALDQAGFEGLVSVARHDSTHRARTFSVFGPSGPQIRRRGWRVRRSRLSVDARLLGELSQFGTGIVPRPFDVDTEDPFASVSDM
jgi:hypothetical protein